MANKLFNIFVSLVILLASNRVSTEAKCPQVFDDLELPISDDLRCYTKFDCLGRVPELDKRLTHQSTETIKAVFGIYTRHREVPSIEFQWKPEQHNNFCNGTGYPFDLNMLEMSSFNASRRTIVMIPGFLTGAVTWANDLVAKWLELGDYNVITVSWPSSNRFSYKTAAGNLPFVARQITIFLHYLTRTFDSSLKDRKFLHGLHLIGHSLGAHMAGFVGYELGGQAARITGLDPAGPEFDKFTDESRLDEKDAQFVDVFHTNAGQLSYMKFAATAPVGIFWQVIKNIPLVASWWTDRYSNEGDTAWFGYEQPLGHVDYYVNNGKTQPGCDTVMHTCDHTRVVQVVKDILDREILVRRSPVHGSGKLDSRLMAYKAENFIQFSVGANFGFECFPLLKAEPFKERSKLLKNCSVPIDIVTNPLEFKRHLEEDYGISFNPPTDQNLRLRYYMKTQSESPLVGDHYLLRIELSQRPTWNETCALKADIMMDGKNKTIAKINKAIEVVDLTQEGFYGLAIPFNHPIPRHPRWLYDDSLKNLMSSPWSPSKDFMSELFTEAVFPTTVELSIIPASSTGLIEAITGFHRYRELNSTGPCELSIKSVSVLPIWPGEEQIMVSYDGRLPQDEVAKSMSFHTITFEEFQSAKVASKDLTCLTLDPDVKFKGQANRLIVSHLAANRLAFEIED